MAITRNRCYSKIIYCRLLNSIIVREYLIIVVIVLHRGVTYMNFVIEICWKTAISWAALKFR